MKITKALGVVTGAVSGLYWTGVVKAQSGLGKYLPEDPLPGDENILQLAQRVLGIAIGLAALVSVVILIVAGYSYMTAAGDEQKIEKATKTLTNAIIGLVICFISIILVEFVLGSVLAPG